MKLRLCHISTAKVIAITCSISYFYGKKGENKTARQTNWDQTRKLTGKNNILLYFHIESALLISKITLLKSVGLILVHRLAKLWNTCRIPVLNNINDSLKNNHHSSCYSCSNPCGVKNLTQTPTDCQHGDGGLLLSLQDETQAQLSRFELPLCQNRWNPAIPSCTAGSRHARAPQRRCRSAVPGTLLLLAPHPSGSGNGPFRALPSPFQTPTTHGSPSQATRHPQCARTVWN